MSARAIGNKQLYRPVYKGKIRAKAEGSVLDVKAQLNFTALLLLFIMFLFTVLMLVAQLWVVFGIALFLCGTTYWMAIDDFKKANARYAGFFKQLAQQEHFQD